MKSGCTEGGNLGALCDPGGPHTEQEVWGRDRELPDGAGG